jgi:hypothetical protein
MPAAGSAGFQQKQNHGQGAALGTIGAADLLDAAVHLAIPAPFWVGLQAMARDQGPTGLKGLVHRTSGVSR